MYFLEDLLTFLENKLEIVNSQLSSSVDGTLLKGQRNGKVMYQWDCRRGGTRTRESVTDNPQMLNELARKEYLRQEEKIIRNDLRLLNMIKDRYVELSPDNILREISGRYKDLPMEFFFYGSGVNNIGVSGSEVKGSGANSCLVTGSEAIGWANEPFQQSTFRPEWKKYVTSRGLRVRSKSELLIAERLYANNIPFRYEAIITIGNKIYAPDFEILKLDGNLAYWEHCGMPNDKAYMRRHKEKMEDYESAGIVPWKNLIVTYEDENAFSLEIIDSEIRNKLLLP